MHHHHHHLHCIVEYQILSSVGPWPWSVTRYFPLRERVPTSKLIPPVRVWRSL